MIYVNARAIIERNVDGLTEIVVQTRNRTGELQVLELPGGRIEAYESLVDAVKREVMEETGLEISFVEGEEKKVISKNREDGFTMECIRPFAVYQTIKGPVDSMGVYFRCKATGELKTVGDDSLHPRWMNVEELKELVMINPKMVSDVDLAGILFYLENR